MYDKGERVYLKAQNQFVVVVGWVLKLSERGYRYIVKGKSGQMTVERSGLMSEKEAGEVGQKPEGK